MVANMNKIQLKSGSALMILAMTSLAALSGCTTGGSGSDPDDVNVVTDPSDFSYVSNATRAGARAHIHDYWSGQSVLYVINAEKEHGWIWHTSAEGQDATLAFRPPSGSIIPLGAALVNVTVEWRNLRQSATQIHGEPFELWIKTAADAQPHYAADLVNGVPTTFETNNSLNDIPHQQLSAWSFVVVVPDAMQLPDGNYHSSWDFMVNMSVTATRGHSIPPFPPHPDLWGDERQKGVISLDVPYFSWGYLEDRRECMPCDNVADVIDRFGLSDGALIPPDVDYVQVFVEHDTDDATVPAAPLSLMYHTSHSWQWQDAPVFDQSGGVVEYRIPVEGRGDSPYANQSVWEFGFRMADEGPGYHHSEGSLRVEAVIHRLAGR